MIILRFLECYLRKNHRDLKYLDRSIDVASSHRSNMCSCIIYEPGRLVWVSLYSLVCVAQFTDDVKHQNIASLR